MYISFYQSIYTFSTIFKGIQVDYLTGENHESDAGVINLVTERPELEALEIFESSCTNKTLRALIGHPRLRIVRNGI